MNYKSRHFHSIIVHVTTAFALLAAISFYCWSMDITFLMMKASEWRLLTLISLFVLFLTSFPAAVSGVFETNKMYPVWHKTHKIKLTLSVLIFVLSLIEIVAILKLYDGVLLGLSVYFINNIIVLMLSYYGLKITLGRQSFAKTSYTPDFFNKEKPYDILDEVRGYIKEKPKRVDFFDLGEE